MSENLSHPSAVESEDACKRHPEIATNKGFRDGYAAGIMDGSSVAMNMPFSEQWTEITERLSDTNTQALAWRTAMAISKLMPGTAVTLDVGSVSPTTAASIIANTSQKITIGTSQLGMTTSFEDVKDRFAQELLALLSNYSEIFIYGRDHEWGIGCGEKLQLKLMELAQTDTEKDVALNVAGVRYD
ncbi:hypothetical protein HER14_07650 [Acidithiobacillus thiooxidans]|uniref:hypothetical protein n=1 Tax=Acidithiobacillus thiooxidans TaxID=930 RepID=UPI001C06FA1C|nr:hypothetical protein [Acidithiobacillus thiooxidans]MBU2750819.1 hypothetical protein [Acidithiobacillus thiooxidans]